MKLFNGDCLEVMKSIPDKSIDMILCDLPYGTTACKWDNVIPFEPLWEQYKRICKPSSNIILFASMPFSALLVNSNISWFSHHLIWQKPQGTNFLLANKMPLKVHEDIFIFHKPDKYLLEGFEDLRNYFEYLLLESKKSKKELIEIFGGRADHCFRFNSIQWGLPTKETYNELINYIKPSKIKSYENLLEMYKNDFGNRTYNPQLTVGTPYISGDGFSGEVTNNRKKIKIKNEGTRKPISILQFNKDKEKLHPTQKPVALLEYLIKTYTNEGETVLDNCMGSGSTGVACVNTNREFIGIELDKNYFNIAKERIESICELNKNKYNR